MKTNKLLHRLLILVIVAVVALGVLGPKQGWGDGGRGDGAHGVTPNVNTTSNQRSNSSSPSDSREGCHACHHGA
jgi:hypothetical protein